MSNVKFYKWKDTNSKFKWMESIKAQFPSGDKEVHDAANKVLKMTELECTFSARWPNDVKMVNGVKAEGILLFVEDDIKNFLVEIENKEKSVVPAKTGKTKWFVWKNQDSAVLWKERVTIAFERSWNQDSLNELEISVSKISKLKSFRCEFGDGKLTDEKSIFVVDGVRFKNQILFLPHEISEYLEEVNGEPQIKQVDTMPISGIFTAVWIEDGFLKSEDFFADGDKVKLQRMDTISVPRDDLVSSFPKQTVFMVMEYKNEIPF